MAAVSQSLVICTTPRTGSNYLCELLLTAWSFGWPAEWFNPATIEEQSTPLELAPGFSLAQYRDAIVQTRHSPNGVFGLKLMWEHFLPLQQRAATEGLIEDASPSLTFLQSFLPTPRFILLERQDLLGQAISHVKAKQSKQWIVRDPAELKTTSAADLYFDPDAITAELATIRREQAAWRALFDGREAPPVFTYEEIVADPASTIARVAEIFDWDPAEISFRLPDNIQVQRDATSDAWRRAYLAHIGSTSVPPQVT